MRTLVIIILMLNFSGQSRKRIVNLGDSRGPTLGGLKLATSTPGVSFLEQTRIQRQIREEERIRDKSIILLQSCIRSRIDLVNYAETLQTNPDSPLYALQFQFICKWYLPNNESELKRQLNVLTERLKNEIDQRSLQILLSSLIRLSTGSTILLTAPIIDLILSKLKLVSDDQIVRLSKIVISLLITNYKDYSTLTPFILKLNTIHVTPDLIFFLSLPGVLSKSFDLKLIWHQLNLSALGNIPLVNLLVNFLDSGNEDTQILADILERITFSVQSNDDEEVEVESNKVYVSNEIIDKLQVLYSPQFVQRITKLMESGNQKLKSVSVHIFTALFTLHPPSKSKLCLWLTVTPNSYRLFYNELKASPVYAAFVTLEKDFLTVFEMQQVTKEESDFFWKIVYSFEELYSYWLLVSNDVESFQEDKLTVEEVRDFMCFLRTLCLSMIFTKNFDDNLKTVSISLLNQLYLKNLRLKFLADLFWVPKELSFNIDGIIHVIAHEEERRFEHEGDSDSDMDEDMDRTITSSTQSKLEVLRKLPFFINFKARVKIFHTLIELDRARLSPVFNNDMFFQPAKLNLEIRRENLLEDAFKAFHNSGSSFKNQLQIIFFNEYGGREAGIDGGGITKEFLNSVATEGFNPNNGLFKETPSDNQMYPNDEIYMKLSKGIEVEEQREKLNYLKFLGQLIGKCFYENVLISLSFAPFFLNKWCQTNLKNLLNDLNYLDSELFQNLMKLLHMSDEDLDQLDLNFSVDEKLNGQDCTFDLVKDGEQVKVNSKNKLNFIHQLSNFKLNQSLYIQSRYFLEGLHELIHASWLNMFDSVELQMLISGEEDDINIADWKENVEYGGYFDDDITIRYFWEVIEELTREERGKLLKFVTSVQKAPLLGFGLLSPKFGIRNSGRDSFRLPTASTCVNLLKLPDYQDKELVRKKILYAINTEARFDLS